MMQQIELSHKTLDMPPFFWLSGHEDMIAAHFRKKPSGMPNGQCDLLQRISNPFWEPSVIRNAFHIQDLISDGHANPSLVRAAPREHTVRQVLQWKATSLVARYE
jgi:hypothetical protein